VNRAAPARTGSSVDHVLPTGPWTFDAEVARVFDDMVARSIPDYVTMRHLVQDLAAAYVLEGSTVVDLGVATGEGLVRVMAGPPADRADATRRPTPTGVDYVGIDNSPDMLARAHERLDGLPGVTLIRHDLSLGLPPAVYKHESASVVLDVLTSHFIPLDRRYRLFRQVYDVLGTGGVFITVAKVAPTGPFDKLFTTLYHDFKAGEGYSREEIAAKARSLEGVLVPDRSAWLGQQLWGAGFAHAECFWRHLNFAGFIALKRVV
jgi:tRNA (cmo5U34)-methyltransferase